MIYILFGSSLGNVLPFHHCKICVADFREEGLFTTPLSSVSSHLEQG